MKILLGIILMFSLFSCMENESQSENAISEKVTVEENMKIDESNLIPVEAYVIKKSKVEEKLPFTGILKPSHSVDIVSEATGKVKKIHREIGSIVIKNEILAVIDDVVAKSNFEQAKAQVLSTENNIKIAELNQKSDKKLTWMSGKYCLYFIFFIKLDFGIRFAYKLRKY